MKVTLQAIVLLLLLIALPAESYTPSRVAKVKLQSEDKRKTAKAKSTKSTKSTKAPGNPNNGDGGADDEGDTGDGSYTPNKPDAFCKNNWTREGKYIFCYQEEGQVCHPNTADCSMTIGEPFCDPDDKSCCVYWDGCAQGCDNYNSTKVCPSVVECDPPNCCGLEGCPDSTRFLRGGL